MRRGSERPTDLIAESGIKADELSRQFGDIKAVRQVTFRVPPGSLLALLGPNGVGKTTTIRMLAALLRPSAGRATVAGIDVVNDPEAVRRRVGIVLDTPGLYEQMTARTYLDFYAQLYDVPRPVGTDRIEMLLDLFDLSARGDEKLGGYSRGMKQKLALARALIHDPPVLFLDEPTASLDPASAKTVRDYILTLKAGDRAVILCTHDLDEAERLADEVAIICRGRIVAQGTPRQLRVGGAATDRVRYRLDLVRPETTAPANHSWTLPGIEIMAVEELDGRTRVEFTSRDGAVAATALLRVALDAGWRIEAMVPEEKSLEEVYLAAIDDGSGVPGGDNRRGRS